MAKIKVCCQAKDCLKEKVVEWDGSWLTKWYCKKHAFMYLENDKFKKRMGFDKNGTDSKK